MTPKSLAVLHLLVERHGHVVTKDELFRSVWTDTAVSDSALTSCIKELRKALQDDPQHPRFIETLHRRGYRFIADVAEPQGRRGRSLIPSRGATPVVGRAAALERMSAALARAAAGTRQLLFVMGEPGIGKTALLNAFIATLGDRPLRVTHGQCVEHFGAQEAYQPLLDAMARLCHQPGGDEVVDRLRRYAPSWLAQLTGVHTATELRALQRRTAGTTPERMRRELIDVLEAVSAISPLVLCIEDLHWADISTLDWIAATAARTDPAALLVIGTARPAEVRTDARLRALSDGLRTKGFCDEIVLPELSERDVCAYVTLRFPSGPGAEAALGRVARAVFRRTEGHPLFLVNVLNELVARGVLLAESGRWRTEGDIDRVVCSIPDDVRRTIARQIARLEPIERSLLEVSSVLAEPYSAATVAAGADVPLADAEAALARLARQNWFVRERQVAEWPDGTVSGTFEFVHALYRDVLSEQLTPARRVELHRKVGERLERGHGERAVEIAAELAAHFAEARDARRAVRYLQGAAEISRRRSAHLAAEAQLRRALSLLEGLPSSPERDEREIEIRIALSSVLMAIRGWGESEQQSHYDRAIELCRSLGRSPHLFAAVWGLWLFHWGRGSLDSAEQIVVTLQDLAAITPETGVTLQACHARWATSFSIGRLDDVLTHASRGDALYDIERHAAMASAYGSHDAGTCGLNFSGRALALAGRLDEAVRQCERSVALARRLGHPFTLAQSLFFSATVHEARQDVDRTRQCAAASARISEEQSFGLLHAWASALEGWSLVAADPATGIPLMERAMSTMRAVGAAQFVTHFLGLLGHAQMKCGRMEDAHRTIDQGLELVEKTGERFYHAELLRLRGELLWAARGDDARREAEGLFVNAMDVARRQGAKLLELRATTSFAQLAGHDRPEEARHTLATALGAVREGRDLPDPRRAADLLDRLAAGPFVVDSATPLV